MWQQYDAKHCKAIQSDSSESEKADECPLILIVEVSLFGNNERVCMTGLSPGSKRTVCNIERFPYCRVCMHFGLAGAK